MAALDRLLSAGFGFVLATTTAPTLTRDGKSAPCVTTPLARSKEMRDAGYWPKFHLIAELTRADFLRLGIADRSVVEFRDAEKARAGVKLNVIGIEDDPADPCIKLTLKEEPAGNGPR